MNKLLVIIVLLFFSACSSDTAYHLDPQVWNNVQFVVETRPSPPTTGMVEFLVIATNADNTHAYDMVISLRMDKDEKWKQAIQDGHVGVYRRALLVQDVRQQRLQVQIHKQDGSEGLLEFPLTQAPG